uniref:hypothetical protein n=1 Tax=Limosilactobacillus reuteri TaxID=1598 RepID=UPI003D8105A5
MEGESLALPPLIRTIIEISKFGQIELSFFSAKIRNRGIPYVSRVFKFASQNGEILIYQGFL